MQIKTKFDQEQLKNKFKKTKSVKNQIWVEKKYDVSNEMVLLNKKLKSSFIQTSSIERC